MPTLNVMVGLPGMGKSYKIAQLLDRHVDNLFVYSTDDYIERVAAQNNMTYNDAWKEFYKPAAKYMNEQVSLAFKQGYDVCWDQTNLVLAARERVLARVPEQYRKICYCFGVPRNQDEWTELERRLKNRPGKTIPWGVMHRMTQDYVEPTLAEGFDEIHLLDLYGHRINT